MIRAAAVVAVALVAAGATPASDTFPGRNGRIAYLTVRQGTPRIWTMAGDGTRQRALTRGGGPLGEQVGGPAWSADGRQLAYTNPLIAVMNADGSGGRLVEGFSLDADAEDVTWSPDGARIAFSSNRDGEAGLWWIGAGGGEAVKLTRHGGKLLEDESPAWSPDGKKILFARGVYDRRTSRTVHDLYVIDPDGTGLRNLTRSSADEQTPDWSPDGTKIAFVRTGPSGGEVWVSAADGSGARKLTTGKISDWHPSWSPDGTRLAFTRGLAGSTPNQWLGKFDVHVMNADGTGVRKLTRNADLDVAPAWQPLPR